MPLCVKQGQIYLKNALVNSTRAFNDLILVTTGGELRE